MSIACVVLMVSLGIGLLVALSIPVMGLYHWWRGDPPGASLHGYRRDDP